MCEGGKGDHPYSQNLKTTVSNNYGHGKQHPSAVLLTLNLLAFLFHLVLEEADHKSHQAFFQDLQALTRYLVFESWERLLDFMSQGLELVMPANSS